MKLNLEVTKFVLQIIFFYSLKVHAIITTVW